jgi:hypothetical protein
MPGLVCNSFIIKNGLLIVHASDKLKVMWQAMEAWRDMMRQGFYIL